jgi:molybdopterin-containing oxidoreductase family membrane subunit
MMPDMKPTETLTANQTHSKAEQLIEELLPKRFSTEGKIWVAILTVICLLGTYAYYRQLRYGLAVTAMRDYASWGIYISNFVFFVAISLVGSLVTAILRLSKIHWSTPLTRISEMIAVASIIMAALVIIVDMGRPDRFLYVIFYARLQSPIVWDVLVITTYLVISLLLLYIPLVPDLAIIRKYQQGIPNWRRKLYDKLSINWRDTPKQVKIMNKSIRLLCIMIVPVALAIHTVTSWLFATTYRPGWDSTNFGPYFVSGAFMVGAAAVIIAMYVFRKYYSMEHYITHHHFDKMGKLLALLSLVYLYFNINEYLLPAYKMKSSEADHILELFTGEFAVMFWSVQILGMVIPILVLLFPQGRKPFPMFLIGIAVVVGAWFKRYLIVVPTLLHPFLPIQNVPEEWTQYYPTWEEWSIAMATLAAALLIITLLVRIFPVIPIYETAKEKRIKLNSKK